MKQKILLAFFILSSIHSFAQDTCRPLISLLDYSGHDDRIPNTHITTIQEVKPDILIDNPPGGYWNGHCLPALYTPLGIHVYSYVVGGYEGTFYHTMEDDSAANILRIDSSKRGGSFGIFLDMVSSYPTVAGMAYISAMYNECQAQGLKLILNPGTAPFDPFLMSHSDFVMSSEVYTGALSPTSSELIDLNRIIVVNQGVTTAAAAAAVTDTARSRGYGHSYACTDYMILPTWIDDYMSLIRYPTPTPAITMSGATFHSSAAYGNQWYSTTTGIISGANGQSFTPSSGGSYYDIVTLSGCSSGHSDTLTLIPTGITGSALSPTFLIYPNPTGDILHIDNAAETTIVLYNMIGTTLLKRKLVSGKETLSIGGLSNGVYMVEISSGGGKSVYKIEKR